MTRRRSRVRALTALLGCAVLSVAACKSGGSAGDSGRDAPADGGDMALADVSVDATLPDMLPLDAPLSLPPVDLCSGGGWCLRHPLPYPTTITAMWTRTSATPQLLYAANDSGVILTYDGTAWRRMASGVTWPLAGVWGRGADELFVTANYGSRGRVRYFDGKSWSQVYLGKYPSTIDAVSGNASAVYAIVYEDASGHVVRDGGASGWTRVHSLPSGQRYYGLTASASGPVFAVGSQGVISVFDGTKWSEQDSGTVNTLYGVWSSGGTTFVVGANGTVLRQATPGAPWTPMATATPATLRAVWGSAADQVYAVGAVSTSLSGHQRYVVLQFDGKAWRTVNEGAPPTATNTAADLLAIAARGGEVLAGGRFGTVVARAADGTWARASSRATDVNLLAAWTDGKRVIVGGYYGRLMRRLPDGKWQQIVLDLPFSVQALWGQGDALFAGGSSVHMYDGKEWKALPSGDNVLVNVYGLWGSGPNDVYAVGANGIILHYDGKALAPMASGTSLSLRGVWGASASAIFAVGENAVLRYDGSQWSTLEVGSTDHHYYGVWGTSPSDLFVVGHDSAAKKAIIRHYDGTTWDDKLVGVDASLLGVSGMSPTDVDAVGTGGLALHYDGTSWSTKSTDLPWTLSAVACAAPLGCFAVSQSAVVLQRSPPAP